MKLKEAKSATQDKSPVSGRDDLVTREVRDGVGIISLNRPEFHNAITEDLRAQLRAAFAWAAVDNALPPAAWALFTLIFLWTPPHVWALAIRLKDDYARAGIPMLPVVRGIDATTKQMLIYGVVLVAFTLALPLLPAFSRSWIYLALACVLGAVFLVWCVLVHVRRPVPPTMPLFRFTIIHLALLFLALIVDSFIFGSRP